MKRAALLALCLSARAYCLDHPSALPPRTFRDANGVARTHTVSSEQIVPIKTALRVAPSPIPLPYNSAPLADTIVCPSQGGYLDAFKYYVVTVPVGAPASFRIILVSLLTL